MMFSRVTRQGRIAAAGAPEEVMTAELLARVYGVSARLERCSQGAPVLIADAVAQPAPG